MVFKEYKTPLALVDFVDFNHIVLIKLSFSYLTSEFQIYIKDYTKHKLHLPD